MGTRGVFATGAGASSCQQHAPCLFRQRQQQIHAVIQSYPPACVLGCDDAYPAQQRVGVVHAQVTASHRLGQLSKSSRVDLTSYPRHPAIQFQHLQERGRGSIARIPRRVGTGEIIIPAGSHAQAVRRAHPVGGRQVDIEGTSLSSSTTQGVGGGRGPTALSRPGTRGRDGTPL